MMPADQYSFNSSFAEVERDFIQQSLERHSNTFAPGLNAQPIEIAVRNSGGQLIGGLLGSTAWGWLLIDMLWIDESLRGQGLGTALLSEAETRAQLLGCTHARTETFDFQALPFYEQHGYEVYGKLPDFPVGHTEFQLRKYLT